MRIQEDIANRVKAQVETNQREYYLREQVKAIHRELGDLHIVQEYLPFIGSHQSHRHIESSRFPGSVRSEQSHDLPLFDINGNMIYNGTCLIFLNEVLRTEHHLLFVCHIQNIFATKKRN